MSIENINNHQAFVCECGSVNFNLLRSLSIECAGCGKQFGLWREMDSELLFAALGEIGNRIEICGASPELTSAVVITSDTRQAIGNKYNPPDNFAVERIKEGIAR